MGMSGLGAGAGNLAASYVPFANFSMPSFQSGGIANSPSIFGESGPEAAVPLSGGRSIPVDLKGGGGHTININNTVNLPPGAGGAPGSYEQGRKTAKMISDGIVAEIEKAMAKHLRPGGILNPRSSIR
jgi:hypothetical protein